MVAVAAFSGSVMAAEAPPEAPIDTITVTAEGRSPPPAVASAVGATSYVAGQEQIADVPGGDSAAFQQVLLRLPGVVQDSYGEIHIRGEHGNAGYRIDGVSLPEGLEGFGQAFDSHFISSAALTTGALPAQYGLKVSGVVDITTKSGSDLDGGEVGVYGGSFDTVRPYFDLGGSAGDVEYFVGASDLRSDLGIENPTASRSALHDETSQPKGFGIVRWRMDEYNTVSLLWGANYSDFEIPDIAGQAPHFSLAGAPSIASSELNERQNEQDYFFVLAYLANYGELSLQSSLFYHYNRIYFTPDAQGDLIYQGVASQTDNLLESKGTQVDGTYALGTAHTLRFGGLVSVESYDRHDSTSVFPVGTNGAQSSDIPFTVLDSDRQGGLLLSLYAQDEWTVAPGFTVNYGLRYDVSEGFTDAEQLSPRLNFVYDPTENTTLHLGYARYFTPPGLEYISAANVARFAGTTNAPTVYAQTPPYPERADYFDGGVLWKADSRLTLTADGFFKQSRGGIDLGQFGDAVILTPFNYGHGHTYGAEISADLADGPWHGRFSFSWVRATAVGITSAQSEFAADELAYINTHWIVLDHDQPFTVSTDAAYSLPDGRSKLFGDFLLGSGLRYGFANLYALEPHYQFNAGIEHRIPLETARLKFLKLRFESTNLLDQRAEIRTGTGVGIAAPQYLPPRGYFGTVSVEF